jgi:hypothetical protein
MNKNNKKNINLPLGDLSLYIQTEAHAAMVL